MNNFKKKLRSDKGASITFGLLLFLVCAVVSSVVLVSATTAAGRMKGIAETDQRYYSVTSASELMKDLIDGESASVVKVTSTTEGKSGTYVFDKPAYEVGDSDFGSGSTASPVRSGAGVKPEFRSITQAAAYLYSSKDLNEDTEGSVSIGTYKLASGLGDENNPDPLEVHVKANVLSDGSIECWVESRESEGGNRFKQRMLFSGTVTKPDHTSVTIDEANVKVDETKTITLTWTLTSVTAM